MSSDTSCQSVKPILFDMRQIVNLFQHDVNSERWKHFNQWDIQQSLEEYSEWFGDVLKELETYDSSHTKIIGDDKDE